MDDLDRLAFRLVRTVRNSYPHLFDQGFTLTDLEERLIPFREARREMADSAPHAWEITMLRLMTGERGYLSTEPELQNACRQALQLPSPSVSHVRSWSNSTVSIGTAAVHLGSERASSNDRESDATSIGIAFASNGLSRTIPANGTRNSTRSSRTPSVAQDKANGANRGDATKPAAAPLASLRDTPGSRSSPSVSNAEHDANGPCRACGGRLPSNTRFTFCPHCGTNLTVRQCPACSTELDVSWRFCVTCGRGADLPELPDSVALGGVR